MKVRVVGGFFFRARDKEFQLAVETGAIADDPHLDALFLQGRQVVHDELTQ